MAVDLCSEPSSGISPRISFSHDFCLSEFASLDQQHQQLSPPPPFRSASPGSSIDFDFCVRKSSFDQDSSSADELFSDGKILPTQIKPKPPSVKPTQPPPSPIDAEVSSTNKREEEDRHQNCKETNYNNNNNIGSDEEAKQQSSSRSFWRFKRSSSVNCGTGYGRTLCPLPLLSRSNSTGSSTASVKRAPLSKDTAKHHHKQPAAATKLSSEHHKKPPLRKTGGYGNGGAGVRVSPVINVASGNMFGLGSIFFSNNKDKSRSKK
ncbi:hypothetical protein LINPERHAP1_LOCUS6724 [Linum perenne]